MPLPRRSADVGKPKKVKCSRFTLARFSCPIPGREAPKFDKPCFITMQLQAKLGGSFAQYKKEPLDLGAILEAHDTVIRKTDDYYVASRLSTPPFLGPQVEYIVQVYIGQQGTNTPALNRGYLTAYSLALFQHTCVQPFLDETPDALVLDAVG